MAEFKLKKGQKIYHIREFSSVMELARRKLIAPDDPIFVPSVGRWVYARSIQELRPILPEPDRVDEVMDLPLEFVEPLAEDLPTGVTIEMDVESMGIRVSAVEPVLEPLSPYRVPDRSLWPGHLARPAAPDEWEDERPTEPGIKPVRRKEPVRLEPLRSFDSKTIDPARALEGARSGGSSRPLEPARLYDNPRTSGARGYEMPTGEEARAADPLFPAEPPRGLGPKSDPRGWEAGRAWGESGRSAEARGWMDSGRGRSDESRGRSDDFRGRSDDFRGRSDESRGRSDDFRGRSDESRGRSDDFRGRSDESRGRADDVRGRSDESRGRADDFRGRADESRGRADDFRGRADESRGREEWARGEDPGRRPNGAAGPSMQEWANGGGRGRPGASPELWEEEGRNGERGTSHRPGNAALKDGPVSFQHWMEEQNRRERANGKRAGEEGRRRRFSLIRIGILLGIVALGFGAFMFYVRSTANITFQPSEGGTVAVADPATKPAAVPGEESPQPVLIAADPGEDARLRELLKPQINPMRTFDQAQDELFGELLNLRVSVADVKLEPVEGDRTKSVRTTPADLTVRIKEGKFTFDQQSGLVGLVVGKYIKRGKIVVRDLILVIERPSEEPLTRKISGRNAAGFFSRELELPQYLLGLQAGTEVP